MISFRAYSFLSIVASVAAVLYAINTQQQFYLITLYLSKSKLNLLIIFNFLVIFCLNFGNFLKWIFFTEIREIEYAHIYEKTKKKLLSIALILISLRETHDIYTFVLFTLLLFGLVLHWLVFKRSEYLIATGTTNKREHAKIILLFYALLLIDLVVFQVIKSKINFRTLQKNVAYFIISFEMLIMILKLVQNIVKYMISLFEMSLKRRWDDKNACFAIIDYIFDLAKFMLDAALFTFILYYDFTNFPIYLIGEMIDSMSKIIKTMKSFIEARALIKKLLSLPDVEDDADFPSPDHTCIICLENIAKGKKLECGHVFHLECLKNWISENNNCPTCREKIEFSKSHGHPQRRANAAEPAPAADNQPLPRAPQQTFQQSRNDMKTNYNEHSSTMEENIEDLDRLLKYRKLKQLNAIKIEEKSKEEDGFEKDEEDQYGMLITSGDRKASFKDKNLFKKNPQRKVRDPTTLITHEYSIGAISYGLPCLAPTRKSLEGEIKRKHIELLNLNLLQFYKEPSSFIKSEEKKKEDVMRNVNVAKEEEVVRNINTVKEEVYEEIEFRKKSEADIRFESVSKKEEDPVVEDISEDTWKDLSVDERRKVIAQKTAARLEKLKERKE